MVEKLLIKNLLILLTYKLADILLENLLDLTF